MPEPIKQFEGETGALEDLPDERDFKFEEIFKAPTVKWEEKPRDKWRRFPIFDQNSSSACFPANAPILMEDFSYKPISEVKIGDYVFTHRGRLKKVVKTFKRKWQGTMIKVDLRGDYREIISTSEHPFLAIKRPEKYRKKISHIRKDELVHSLPIDFYEARELQKGDWLALPFNDVIKDKTIYSFEKDPDFLWLLGLYLAEGSNINTCGILLSLHRKEFDWYERIKRIMGKYDTSVTYSFKTNNGLSIRIFGKRWLKLFNELGGRFCDKKEINKRLMFLEPHLQMKIVEGFIDGDGHIGKDGRTTMVSTSYKLLLQIRTILLRNGIFSSFRKRKEREDRKNAWSSEFCKTSYSFIKDGYCFVSIHKISKIPAYAGGHVYNLEVQDDNSYLVNGVAVHNCVAFSTAKVLGIENYLEETKFVRVSARDIYERRKNKPDKGMYLRDAMKIGHEFGATFEQLMPSERMNESQANDASDRTPLCEIVAKPARGGSYISIPFEINSIASIISKGKGVLLGARFNHGDWHNPEVITRKDGRLGHAFVGVDYTIWKGKRAIIFSNSWGINWGFQGQGILTEDQFSGLMGAWYYEDLKNENNLGIPKPEWKFEKNLEFGLKNDEDVKMLQLCLQHLGMYPKNAITSGNFLGVTLRAVQVFQLQFKNDISRYAGYQIKGTGFVGPGTRGKLNELFYKGREQIKINKYE